MPKRYYLLLTVITLAAAFLRLWRLTEVPPGLHYDLAATALLGNDVAFHGFRPIFITAYTGHEALFYYWLAGWFRLIGSSVFALRLSAAMLGILAVPAAFFALRQVLRHERAPEAQAALGAALLAFAFFHVTFSRFGFRVISEPVVQALALGFVVRGVWKAGSGRRRAWLDLLLGGLFTGLAAYTYLAARLFPVPLAIYWLAVLIGAWRAGRLRRYGAGFGLFTAGAVAAFAPLGLYFLRHPEDFLNRAGQVAPRAGETALLLDGVRRALEMIFVRGEPYDRYNLPGLPLFGPLLGFFFVVGLLVTVWNAFRPRLHTYTPAHSHTFPQRASEILLLAWLPAMLLPTALAVHDIYPSNIRAFGLIPLLFAFPARGLLASYRWLQKLWPGPLIPYPYPLAVVILITLAAGTWSTARNYFGTWANLPSQRLNNDADLAAIAEYLNAQDLADTRVYVSAIHYRHPTLAYLARDFSSIYWLTGGTSLAIPAEGQALYLFARSAAPPEEWIAGWDARLVAAPAPEGVPDYRAYRFAAGEAPPLPEFAPLAENFGHVATLTGYRVIPEAERLLLDLRWHIENPAPAGDFLPYARLYDEHGLGWSQSGGFSYPSEQWQPGDTVLTRVSVPLPAGLPPAEYVLKVGLYSAGTQTSLPRLDAQGGYAGDRAALPAVTLAGRIQAAVQALAADHAFTPPAAGGLAGPLQLLGYSLNSHAPRQGERLQFGLYWHAAETVSVEGLSLTLGGREVAAAAPALDALPAQAVLASRHLLKVPADLPPGPAELVVNVPGQGSATLATLDVQGVTRQFEPPPVETQAGANLGGLAALHGYTLAPGQPAALTLAWQALSPMDQDYTVFVHVRDAGGALAAQRDAQPRDGAYPTSLWEPGEYVTDEYRFDLASGDYWIEVGLYLPETGERVRLEGGGDALRLDRFTVP